jgi:membrane-bound metal-dependent hydrolase YbcI (DUF457 family)
MITPIIFWFLAAVGFVLVIYTFLDSENRIYGHVFAGVIATILFFLLGTTMITGNVGEVQAIATAKTTVNSTATYVYTTATIPLQDTSVGYLFIFLAVFALIVTTMAVIEVVREFTSGEGYEID